MTGERGMNAVGKTYLCVALLAIFVAGAGLFYVNRQAETNAMTAQPKNLSPDCEFATLGGGCFWCLEAVFEQVQGVERVESGYVGGSTVNPTYREICTGMTGHAEVVQVAFDPKVISFREILQIFFVIHDPTTLNRQGHDVGSQYRSAIFYHSPEEKKTAEALIVELDAGKTWDDPIVTQVAALEKFYRAEDYHQGYFRANPRQPYCQAVVAPKVAKLRKHFLAKLKPSS
jgi:peptide-methionine (S)-S-oxide reductase